MKKYILILILVITAISFEACKTDDLELTNPNGISTGDFPSTTAELKSGLNAVYAPLQAFGLHARYIPFMMDNMAGENTGRAALSADLQAFENMNFTAVNNDIFLYWKSCYSGIQRANLLLDNLARIEGIQDINADDKNNYIGEIRFLRAYYYFLLTSRFGDVPLYTTVNHDGKGIAKSTQEEVYQLIIADLEIAATKLKVKSDAEIGRATSGAANTLLGKVYLFRKEYTKAKIAFDKVINSMEYSLTADFFDNFTTEAEFNSESIFEVDFDFAAVGGNAWAANWGGTDEGTGAGAQELSARSREYGHLGWHNVNPSNALVNSFESTDPRLHATFFFPGDLYGTGIAITQDQIGAEMTAWRKYELAYKQDGEGGLSDINHRVMRYADVLLMAAEVENETSGMTKAIDYLNEVRDRVGMPNYGSANMNPTYPVTNKAEVFAAIVHERQVELAGEQTRFPDLVRWEMAAAQIPNFVIGKHEVFPIPQKEIDTNINLTNADQNEGYQ